MKRNILSIILVILPLIAMSQNIGWVYQHMPSELSPILNTSQRFELIENAKEGRTEHVTNNLNGKSHILAYNEQQHYVKVATTTNSTLAIKIIPISPTEYFTVIIHTVCAPICSSHITTYNQNWEKIDTKLPSFKTSDFLTMKHNLSAEELEMINPIFVSADFSTTSETIEFTNQTHKTLPLKLQEHYLPFLQTYMIPLASILP